MIQRRLARWAVGVTAIVLFAFVVRDLPRIGMLMILVCGLAGIAYHVMRTWGSRPPPRSAGERDTRDVQRDIPPGPTD
jgi:hypothetical protein